MFYSILYPSKEYGATSATAPVSFKDMNLDQIFYPITKEKQDFELDSYFYTPLPDVKSVVYRQDVMRELEDPKLRSLLGGVSVMVSGIGMTMKRIYEQMGALFQEKWRDNYLVRGQLLNCADGYCNAIANLAGTLTGLSFKSEGLRGFAEYLANYCDSVEFKELRSRIKTLREKLKSVEYNMLVSGAKIRVRKFDGEGAYSGELISLFEKFRQNNAEHYTRPLPEFPESEKVEAAILNMVANVYKEVFTELNDFSEKYINFMDDTLLLFAREIQFYISWHDSIQTLKDAGLSFCYPKVIDGDGDIYARDTFDIALARRIRGVGIVANDIQLKFPERIIIITGPNQGGKTTYARSFAQAHFLASLGLCVPGTEAQLFLCDKVLTHFGKQEDLAMLSGQLQDDLTRLRVVFDNATRRSVLIINEIFASTTLQDALLLGHRMMDRLTKLGAPTLVITFLDELADHGPETISMVSSVQEDDPSKRTYKIVRKKPDGLAFAMHIARKHSVTYEMLSERLKK